jgi:large subunit ribosomal protein L20
VRETLLRAWAYGTRDRRHKKRIFRRLWIVRLNAAARVRGMTYSQLIDGLNKAKITLNRKQLSEIAIHDPKAFDTLVAEAKSARK